MYAQLSREYCVVGPSPTGNSTGSEADFADAINRAAYGETVYVAPGTYTFNSAVNVTKQGVRLAGLGGVTLVPAATGSVGLFNVTGEDFSMQNLKIQTSTPFAGQSAVKMAADEFNMVNCRVRILGPATDFVAIDLGDGTSRSDALFQGNSFSSNATATGVVFVKSTGGQFTRFVANKFGNKVTSVAAPCRCKHAILLTDEIYGTMGSNTFIQVGDSASQALSIIRNVTTNAAGSAPSSAEGQHFAYTGNFFELCAAPTLINLKGGRFSALSGNVFGRNLFASGGIIFLESDAIGPGKSLTITGNEFHNTGAVGQGGPAIVAQSTYDLIYSNNMHTICNVLQVSIEGTSKRCSIIGNRFTANGSPTSPVIASAIDLGGPAALQNHLVALNVCGATSAAGSTGRFTNVLTAVGLNEGVIPGVSDYHAVENVNLVSVT